MSGRNELPDVPIFGFIGGIPETFGGRTGVCLQRANTFAELGNRHIDILTLSPAHGVTPELITARLRQEGRIGDRVEIRNIWADLRRASDGQLASLGTHSTAPLDAEAGTPPPFNGDFDLPTHNATGKVVRTDRFREDGTRVTSYVVGEGSGTHRIPRSVALYDRTGTIVGRWHEQCELYFAWLDARIGADPAILINDGPLLARYMYRYQRDNLVFVQTIHSLHATDPAHPVGNLVPTYAPTLTHMEQFDRVAILTRAQRDDLERTHLGTDNLAVLPNMVVGPPAADVADRNRSSGLMLARMSHQKRIDHAVRAISAVRKAGHAVSLNVYGVDDDASEEIATLIETLGSRESTRMCGFDPRARDRFTQASFTLATSMFEGQGLAVLEAMLAGCIPIAYDINYGPQDIITDGVNGFLVPDGDIDALAAAISSFLQLPESTVVGMRQAAVKRALEFSPENITERWASVLTQALKDKRPSSKLEGDAILKSVQTDQEAATISIELSGQAARHLEWALLTWTQRKGNEFGRLPADNVKRAPLHPAATISVKIPTDYLHTLAGSTLDLWIDVRAHGVPGRLRIKGVPASLQEPLGAHELYATKYGSLSLRPRAQTSS